MTSRASALLLPALLAGACAEKSGLVRWEDVEPAPTDPGHVAAAVAPPGKASPEKAPPEKAPPEKAPPERAPPKVASTGGLPRAPIAAARTLLVNGTPVDDGALVELPALELACLADARALTEPSRVAARVSEQGEKLGASLGAFAFVVLERDPARSITDPPPRFCRPLERAAVLVAPLLHRSEPAGRWLVRRAKDGVVADAAALVLECRAKGLTPSGRPRALVDADGALVALAIPVGAGGS
ncbi:MAG: hypothetical protein A2138_10510 [Deltaproteobacteria bacterium RBG_16_71_12]|nr:MAG: hypothetical protein A2138_10510 [Deltaproteobacteria bacterium RBG_16_71_12]